MKKIILSVGLVLGLFSTQLSKAQDVYLTNAAEIKFFSKSPLEDISADSKNVGAAINLKTRKVVFSLKVTTFKFENSLMQEHFNENYIESDKFPTAKFEGTIVDDKNQDLTKDGVYDLKVKGILNIHGVEKEYNIPIKLEVEQGKVIGSCKFMVKVADHNIKIPSMVVKNIAEEVELTVNAIMEPKK